MANNLYILWLPKYFDEFLSSAPNKKNSNQEQENYDYIDKVKKLFLSKKCNFLSGLKIVNNNTNSITSNNKDNFFANWGEVNLENDKSHEEIKIIFNEYGFYYFEFTGIYESKCKEIIKCFFSKDNNYALLTDTQQDVLRGTFLNDNLDYKEFSKKKDERVIKLEDFVIESCYKVNKEDILKNSDIIKKRAKQLNENDYKIKKGECFDLNLFNEIAKDLRDSCSTLFNEKILKKILQDIYEEKAIVSFLTTVVSAKYFDRIIKSIKVVREGLTGKVIYMTPQNINSIDTAYTDNEVFRKWSEDKIENYVQLLISKKPLFTKIDNALKSSYYITIGELTPQGHIIDKEDIDSLVYYHEWSALLTYFSETTESLREILKLYHSNRSYAELEEIKHYESNNHDKEDINLLIKSNENKLGATEDSKTLLMIMAIFITGLVAIPDMIGSIDSFFDINTTLPSIDIPFSQTIDTLFKNSRVYIPKSIVALVFYTLLIYLSVRYLIGKEGIKQTKKIIQKYKQEIKDIKSKKYIKSSSDDFDLLEHRSNMPVKSYTCYEPNNCKYKNVTIQYFEHMSIHRFVRFLEKLQITIKKDKEGQDKESYNFLPEIVTLENLKKGKGEFEERLYHKLKKNRTTKFSVNRIDKAKIKVTMRYRVNRIAIDEFLDYYINLDSYIRFYRNFCTKNSNRDTCNSSCNEICEKINSDEVVKNLKEAFKEIDAELSFVAIYTFTLNSKTLDYNQEKSFNIYKDSFRVYFHIDKFPTNYYLSKFDLIGTQKSNNKNSLNLEPYDPLSEMIYLVFLGRLKGYNYLLEKN